MRKENLTRKISREAGIKRKDANEIFDKVIDLITKDLKKGNDVSLEGFGEFRIARSKMKIVLKKNSRTVYPPKDTVVFNPDISLLTNLNRDE